MTGRFRASFRSGNLAEALGILLLQGTAAVAPVPRQEDFGLDAVASLLRCDEDGNYYAEDSFGVQFKSASTKSIALNETGLCWLLHQELPIFIGLVSRRHARISLYTTIFVNQAALALHLKQAKLYFGVSKLPELFSIGPARWSGGRAIASHCLQKIN